MRELTDKLESEGFLSRTEWERFLTMQDETGEQYLFSRARTVREAVYGKDVYIRGLIEFTSYCKNDCYYCGLRRGNAHASRYRLSKEEILSCAEQGYELGFRTIVLQGGEDAWFSDDRIVEIIRSIKDACPGCAVTLSIGEKRSQSYQRFYDAGADRYLLRHESADESHYAKLHPQELSGAERKKCLEDLKRIGFQTGCGFMVGSPYQTVENLIEDLTFIYHFRPAMVGIGPFIPHKDTPFAGKSGGSADLTLRLLAILRLMQPNLLLPATTALATADQDGTARGILAGANVVMPNLSPPDMRRKYMIYDNKRITGAEAAESLDVLRRHMNKIGYTVVVDRGDCKTEEPIMIQNSDL